MDKQKVKKGRMRGANFRNLLIILLLISLGCTNKRYTSKLNIEERLATNNSGYYTKSDTKFGRSIYGIVFDLDNRKPLENVIIKMGCFNTETDINGRFKFHINSEKEFLFFLNCSSIGYISLETSPIMYLNNSVEVNFYIQEDKRPIINCEGVFVK